MRYDRQEACNAWLTHVHFSYHQLRKLMNEFETSECVYELICSNKCDELADFIKDSQLAELKKLASKDKMHEMLVQMQKNGIHIMSMDDPVYPQDLLDINDPPIFLYWKGNVETLRNRKITMVGTRRASINALDATQQIAKQLSESGVTIVSGLAQGIDQAAHRGCLQGKSPTIGVAACGIDVNYPSDSERLKEEMIAKGGVIISEYPPGTRASKWTFPVRNRIMSGLSRAVIMMECHIKSGSMSTVNHALDQGKEVFAWPGIAQSETSQGAHQLIREGARYFTTARDVLEDMQWQNLYTPQKEEAKALPPLNDTQRIVYLQLKKGQQSMDEISMATGIESAALNSTLTMLQLLGLIKALPGKIYKII